MICLKKNQNPDDLNEIKTSSDISVFNENEDLIENYILSKDSKGLMQFLSSNLNDNEISSVFDRCYSFPSFYEELYKDG